MSIDIGVLQPAKFLRNFDAQALNPAALPPTRTWDFSFSATLTPKL